MKTLLLQALFMLLSVNLIAQPFSTVLEKINHTDGSQRQGILDEYVKRPHEIPITEGTTVYFIYKGEATAVSLAGDATGWQPSVVMERIPATDYWFCKSGFESGARLEYKFVLNGKEWILDPLNPKIFTGGTGQNSVLTMPGYEQSPFIFERESTPWSQCSDTVIKSRYMKQDRPVRICLPAGYDGQSGRYPVVVFHDGFEFCDLGSARHIIDNMTFEGKISPVIAVFVQPVQRDREYSGNLQKSYTRFITRELVPFLDRNYRTLPDAGDRATVGISNGGNIALWLGGNYPGIFGKAAAQSSNVEANVLKAFRNNDISRLKIWLDMGRYDLPVLVPRVQNLKKVLDDRKADYSYKEYPEGHSWASWRNHLPEILMNFFPAK
jgi:enterochelin esterase family protein